MTTKIKHTPNPDAVAYHCDEIIQSDTLGPVRIIAYAESQFDYRPDFSAYRVTVHIDDTLTINGKKYSGVQATATTYERNPNPFLYSHPECWRNPLTSSAYDAVKAATDPIISQYVAKRGGADALKRELRNNWRRSKANYLHDKAERLKEDAAKLLATIEE